VLLLLLCGHLFYLALVQNILLDITSTFEQQQSCYRNTLDVKISYPNYIATLLFVLIFLHIYKHTKLNKKKELFVK